MVVSAVTSSQLIPSAATTAPASPPSNQSKCRSDSAPASCTTQISDEGRIRAALDRLHSAAPALADDAASSSRAPLSSKSSPRTATTDTDAAASAYAADVARSAQRPVAVPEAPEAPEAKEGDRDEDDAARAPRSVPAQNFSHDRVANAAHAAVVVEASSNTAPSAVQNTALPQRASGNAENISPRTVSDFHAALNALQPKETQATSDDVESPASKGDAVAQIVTRSGEGVADHVTSVTQALAKVSANEVVRAPAAPSSASPQQGLTASGATQQVKELNTQYAQLGDLVQSLNQSDQRLGATLAQVDASQSSQSSLMNRLNTIANLMTP